MNSAASKAFKVPFKVDRGGSPACMSDIHLLADVYGMFKDGKKSVTLEFEMNRNPMKRTMEFKIFKTCVLQKGDPSTCLSRGCECGMSMWTYDNLTSLESELFAGPATSC